jgi:hypothetical protein
MILNETQQQISAFGVNKNGKNLFTPMNETCSEFSCDYTSLATELLPGL